MKWKGTSIPRRLRQEWDHDIHNHQGDDHPTQREPPAELSIGAANAEIDPVRNDNAEIVGHEDEREAGAAVVRLRKLAHPGRDDGVDEADAEPGDDTRADEHVRVDTAGHERAAEDAKGRADENAALTSNLVTDPAYIVDVSTTVDVSMDSEEFTSDEASPDTSKVVSRRETALLGRVGHHAVGSDTGHVNEARRATDSTQDTLVVTWSGRKTDQLSGHGSKSKPTKRHIPS